MKNAGWGSKLFPEDLHVLIAELLPDESDREFGDEWPELRHHLSLIIAVAAADLRSRGPNCPIPATYGGLCRLLSNAPKYLTDWFTGIINTGTNRPIPPAITQNARSILSLPKKERDLFFQMMANFVRGYVQRQTSDI